MHRHARTHTHTNTQTHENIAREWYQLCIDSRRSPWGVTPCFCTHPFPAHFLSHTAKKPNPKPKGNGCVCRNRIGGRRCAANGICRSVQGEECNLRHERVAGCHCRGPYRPSSYARQDETSHSSLLRASADFHHGNHVDRAREDADGVRMLLSSGESNRRHP